MWKKIQKYVPTREPDVWEWSCHDTVQWEDLDCDLLQRSREGSWEWWLAQFCVPLAATAVGTAAGGPVLQYIMNVHGFRNDLEEYDVEDSKRRKSAESDKDSPSIELFFRFAQDRNPNQNRTTRGRSESDENEETRPIEVEGSLCESQNVDGDSYVEFLNQLDEKLGTRPDIDELLETVVPFSANAEFVVGQRYNSNDEGSISFRDLTVTIQLIEFFLETNIRVTGEAPENLRQLSFDPDIDYSRNIISVGGPVPNWYTRNIMYGDEVEIPYRFNLNPNENTRDLRDLSPEELRDIGHDDTGSFEDVPDWYIANQSGEPLDIAGDTAEPKSRGNPPISRDYFTIVKAPNVHVDAKSNDSRCLLLAGCHGLGTLASVKALRNPEILNRIHSEVGNDPFQAVGYVTVSEESSEVHIPIIEPIGIS